MAFMDVALRKSRLLELAVDIAREDPAAQGNPITPFAQDAKSSVWHGLTVQVQAMPVKAPCQTGVLMKCARAGDVPLVVEG